MKWEEMSGLTKYLETMRGNSLSKEVAPSFVDNGEYFVYPFKSIREELEAFPELPTIALAKIKQLTADIDLELHGLENMLVLLSGRDDWHSNAARIFWTVMYSNKIDKLKRELDRFQFIAKVCVGDDKSVAFDEKLETAKRSDIVMIASRFGTVKKMGSKHFMNCLFHQEDTPSMVLYPDSSSFHCFGCGKSGDAIDILMERGGLTFAEAVKELT